MTDETQVQEKVMAAYQIAMRGDFNHARMILEEALYDDPQFIEAWLLLADLAESGDEARQCYQMVLEVAPDNWIAQQRLKLLFNKQQTAVPVVKQSDDYFDTVEPETDEMDFSSFLAAEEYFTEEEIPTKETFRQFLVENRKWTIPMGIGLAGLLALIGVAWVASVVYMAWYMGFLIVGG